MTEQTQPTDAELIAFATEEQFMLFCDPDEFTDIARAVLAKWGTPAGAGEVADLADAVNLARNALGPYDCAITKKGVRVLAEAVLSMDAALTTPQPTNSGSLPEMKEINDLQPTQAQAGAVPLKYARLHAISLDYSDSEDECTGFRDGWRAAEKHHGIKGADHG